MVRPRKIGDFKSTIGHVAQTSHYQVFFDGLSGSLFNHLASKGVDKRFISERAGLLCNSASIPGGDGGGGLGFKGVGAGGAGTANTGSGGGGGGSSGGDGGTGVVILRMGQAASSTTGSPTVTQSGSDYIYTFNANGTLTI